MLDLEIEAHKLGIPAKTRHNEVAPNQFELAPIFEETNLANDHNMLIMSVMAEVARRHNFRILLHESRLPESTDQANITTGVSEPIPAHCFSLPERLRWRTSVHNIRG